MFEEITGFFLNSLAVGETALAENVRNDWQIFCTQELLGNRLFNCGGGSVWECLYRFALSTALTAIITLQSVHYVSDSSVITKWLIAESLTVGPFQFYPSTILKVPKCEIFNPSDFYYFYTIKPFWVDDFVVKILTYYFNFGGRQASFSF
jgi:hypothetical protein